MNTNAVVVSDLLNTAEQGQHRKFQFLSNWYEYKNVKQLRRAHVLLVGSLKQSLKKQLNRHCKAVNIGETKIVNLLAYCSTINMLTFYEEELRILDDMIYEYEAYLMEDGNLVFAWLFNEPRPVDKFYDHRR